MSLFPVRITELEGDGLLDDFFELLWTRTSTESSNFRIPETVIFKYRQPYAWFFTSTDGTVKRKSRTNLTTPKIIEVFLRNPSPSGIIASFHRASGGTVITQHFDRAAFLEFLDARAMPDGVLQKFVHPKSPQNSILHAFWSPQICIVEKYENSVCLADTRKSATERAGTFELLAPNAAASAVWGYRTPSEVDRIAKSVVSHINSVSHGKIKLIRLGLCLKQDAKDRFVLLFVTSARVHSNSPLHAKFTISRSAGEKCGTCGKLSLVLNDDLCDGCYLKSIENDGPGNFLNLKGTQSLDPSKVKQRTEETRQAIIIRETEKRRRQNVKFPGEVKMKNLHKKESAVQRRLRDTSCARRSLEDLLAKYSDKLGGPGGEIEGGDGGLLFPGISDGLRNTALTYMRQIDKALSN